MQYKVGYQTVNTDLSLRARSIVVEGKNPTDARAVATKHISADHKFFEIISIKPFGSHTVSDLKG